MTTFWWARALKASHLEIARGNLSSYARGLAGHSNLELSFGYLRAISAVEDAVEKDKDTLRYTAARDLGIAIPLMIADLLNANADVVEYIGSKTWSRDEELMLRAKVLEILDNFEKKHRHIIYC